MAEILEWRGRVYHRSDVPREPHIGRPAKPYEISIKGDFDSTSGDLGIVKVAVFNATEFQVMYPPRGGVYNPRNITIEARPYYYERDEQGKRHRVYKVQCARCGFYQRRDAFAPDKRKRNGLQSICHSCDAARKRHVEETAIAA